MNKIKILNLLIITLAINVKAPAQNSDIVADLIRLSETYRLSGEIQSAIWPGLEKTPFPVLIVTTEEEYLIGYERIPNGFKSMGYSTILQKEILSRPRNFDVGLLATFPAFGLPPVVVVGRAENTNKTSEEWLLTILHEHFHQYQMSDPEYFSVVAALGLSKGDETGMWMLNYPFPYQADNVANTFDSLSKRLAVLLTGEFNPVEYQQFWQSYSSFLQSLNDDDRRYLSFQVWQEGIARYVELRFSEMAAEFYNLSVEFNTLNDIKSFSYLANKLRMGIINDLKNSNLQAMERISFYSFGAGLALLLDKRGETWKNLYNKEKFAIENYVNRN